MSHFYLGHRDVASLRNLEARNDNISSHITIDSAVGGVYVNGRRGVAQIHISSVGGENYPFAIDAAAGNLSVGRCAVGNPIGLSDSGFWSLAECLRPKKHR